MSIACLQKMTRNGFSYLNTLQPVWLLLIRVWIAYAFFRSGLTKIDDFETTIFLFAEEYKVPVISPEFAAYSGTFFELVMPVLLVLGLGARFAAVPLLVMTAVIQFTYQDHVQHYYWAIILTGIIIYGAGPLSLDRIIAKRCNQIT